MAKREEAVAIVPVSGELVRDSGIPLEVITTAVDRELERIGVDPHRGDYVIVAVEYGRAPSVSRAIAAALGIEVQG